MLPRVARLVLALLALAAVTPGSVAPGAAAQGINLPTCRLCEKVADPPLATTLRCTVAPDGKPNAGVVRAFGPSTCKVDGNTSTITFPGSITRISMTIATPRASRKWSTDSAASADDAADAAGGPGASVLLNRAIASITITTSTGQTRTCGNGARGRKYREFAYTEGKAWSVARIWSIKCSPAGNIVWNAFRLAFTAQPLPPPPSPSPVVSPPPVTTTASLRIFTVVRADTDAGCAQAGLLEALLRAIRDSLNTITGGVSVARLDLLSCGPVARRRLAATSDVQAESFATLTGSFSVSARDAWIAKYNANPGGTLGILLGGTVLRGSAAPAALFSPSPSPSPVYGSPSPRPYGA